MVLAELKSHRSGPPHRSGPTWLYRTYNCLALRHPDQPAVRPSHIIGTPPSHSGSMVAITREDLQGALPDVTSTLTAAGLDGAVTIMRDQYGVPRACVPACCGSRCQARAHSLALLRA